MCIFSKSEDAIKLQFGTLVDKKCIKVNDTIVLPGLYEVKVKLYQDVVASVKLQAEREV